MARAMYDFHLPLPEDLHEMLREEVESSGHPATVVAREALQSWLVQQRKRRRHLDEPPERSRGAAMAAALQRIADAGGPEIRDPLQWERDLRTDRPLPGRKP
jgi:hypothetical protein